MSEALSREAQDSAVSRNLRKLTHQEARERSYRNLVKARNARSASQNSPYDSTLVRVCMLEQLYVRSGETLKARDWQLDVSEALILGLDVIVISGTGTGKTVPFILPLFAPGNSSKMVIIIAPLNSL